MSDDVKEFQLLPCPFCGGQPELRGLGEDEPDNAGGWVVQCVGCQASSRVHFSVKEDARPHVISAWNARTAADKTAECERLREAARIAENGNPWRFDGGSRSDLNRGYIAGRKEAATAIRAKVKEPTNV